MRVRVKLHASLKELIPSGAGEVELPDGSNAKALLETLGIDSEMREFVTINGVQEDPETASLTDGDEVHVFPPVVGGSRSPYLDEGIRLFREGQYFLAHETLEEHWIEAEPSDRDFYQGLIHLAVGFHHFERGNSKGAKLQFEKADKRLSGYPDELHGVDLGALRKFLASAPGRIGAGEELVAPEI